MWCIIPAAGRGTRLSSVRNGRPKPLVEVDGTPLLHRLILDVEEVVSGICVVVPPPENGGKAVRRALEDLELRVDVETVTQPDRRGVADAVWLCKETLDGPFAVIMGDVYYASPIAPYIAALARGELPALLVEAASRETPDPAGVVTVRGDRVTAIEKRPVRRTDQFRVAGAFAFPEDAFPAFEAARPGTGEFELEAVVRHLLKRKRVGTVVYEGWRKNVNTPRDLREVRERIRLDRDP